MADTVLTVQQIEDIFQTWTSQALGVTDPGAVRIGWPMDGAPAWHITDDVCFVLVTYVDNPITRQIERSYSPLDPDNANMAHSYIDSVRVSWTLYGPNAFERADIIRAALFQPSTTDTLAANNLGLVTDVPMPIRVPELFNGQWWSRATLYADFNQLVIRQTSVPYITGSDVRIVEG
ncbi:phage neck terminator protein [Alicyclobacillus macrosporangiidus]|uniref:Phage neck terminator protein gp12-like domain-containing protein n=1 Tax=Alicyclobacillus macrosporangiidus TaxID=392015 RepID=A0A1I7IDQ8_9BACL|nr:hypothetical protein [Alicyclobacillus macrosporangiidus]SFU71103.1 hypothetical protein SAMN05421543_106160 [Alicyclobacillus macrosporangiidus]